MTVGFSHERHDVLDRRCRVGMVTDTSFANPGAFTATGIHRAHFTILTPELQLTRCRVFLRFHLLEFLSRFRRRFHLHRLLVDGIELRLFRHALASQEVERETEKQEHR